MATLLELRTLGGLAVRGEHGPVEGAGSQKRRLALLALVDAAGERGISREKLLSFLWGDADLEKARGALAQALYSLRKALGSEELFLGTSEIRLNRAVLDSDRARFLERLSAGDLEGAVACYHGPYLDGFSITEAPEFVIWVDGERASLTHRYVTALQKLAARVEAAGDALAAVGWWRKLVVVDPLNGQLALGLMRALAHAGDRAGAIQHARLYERLVRQELDVAGDAEVQAFAEQLKKATATTPIPDAAPGPPTRATTTPTPQQPPAGQADPAPPARPSLAEQLSTAEVVAVAMERLKSSRSAFDSYAGVQRAAERDRLRSPGERPPRSLAAIQASFAPDRYRVVREVGAGGMATVYLARDVRHDREVAIKVLHQDLGDALGADRFSAEIRTTARLQHPHIVPLLDSGTAQGPAGLLLYYVMPYVAGESLRARLTRERQLPLEDARRIAREVADALGYAHGQQVVHRDIKPENLLLQGAHVLIADFGLAMAVKAAGGERVAQAGLSLGTPEYMAPEQAMGKDAVDHRADLYALGAVTYEMLTGAPPFTGATAQAIVARLLTERPMSPRVVRDTVPDGLQATILRALEKVPADRFPTAAAFAEALDAQAPPAPAEPGATTARAATTAREKPSRWRLVAGVAAVASLGAAGLYAARPQAPRALAVGAVTRITRSRDTLNFDAAISPDGRFVAYASGTAGHMQIFVRQVSGSAPLPVVTRIEGDHRWPRWSPDGSKLAFVAGGAIHVIPALGGVAQRVVTLWRLGGQPAWSPDGTTLAYSDSAGIYVIPATGGTPRRVVRTLEAHSPSWSPDGRRIAYVVENLASVGSDSYGNAAPSSIWTASAAGGDTALVSPADHLNTAPAWWPDGRSLLFISNRDGPRDVYRQPVDSRGRPQAGLARVTSGLEPVTISLTRDGSQMAYSTLVLRDNIWMAPIAASPAASLAGLRPVTTEKQSIEGIALSHDGNWLAYDSDRGGNLDVYKVAFDGTQAVGEPIAITTDTGPDYEPRWSPDDREIVFYSRRFGTRDLFTVQADGHGEARITTLPGNEYYPEWSPDGTQLAFSSQVSFDWDAMVMARTAGGTWGTPRRVLPGAQSAIDVRWLPDGSSLVLVRGDTLGMVPLQGGAFRALASEASLGEKVTFIAAGPSRAAVYVQTRDATGVCSYWSVPTNGAPPQRLLRLSDPGRRTRRVEFDTDGKRLFFTIAEDEADVAVVSLKEPER